MTQSLNGSMIQFFNKHFGLLQIFCVKPLGKPVVNARQALVCFALLALLLPQACKIHRSTEFEGFGVLLLCNVDGFEKVGYGSASVGVLGVGCWVLGAVDWQLTTDH